MTLHPLRTGRVLLLVTAAGACLLLPNLGGGRVLTYHEVCFAEPAREMIATNHFVVPTIAGEVFPDKPPLTHWLVAASMMLFRSEAEWVVRLPIALTGIGAALVIAAVGARWFSESVALLAGLVQLSAFYVLMEARLAECDMLLCLLTTSAFAVFALGEVPAADGRTVRRWWVAVLLHSLLGLSFLCKGPLALAIIGAPTWLWLIARREWRSFLFWLHPVGVAVSLLMVFGWPAAAFEARPEILDGWRRHNLERFSGAMPGETASPVFYLWMIPLLTLPWTPWWMAQLTPGRWKSMTPSQKRLASLLLWTIVPGLLLLSASAWKHKHYVVPLLPPLSLLAGCALAGFAASPPPALLRRFGDSRRIVATMFATVWIGSIVALGWIVPRYDSYRDQTEFAAAVRAAVPAGTSISVPHFPAPNRVLQLPENQITYYLPLGVTPFEVHEIHQMLQPAREAYVVGPAWLNERLADLGQVETLARCRSIRSGMAEKDRLSLFRVSPVHAVADREGATRK